MQYAVTVTNRYTTSEWLHAYAQVPDHATVAASAISGGGSCGQGVTTCGAGQTISWSLGYVGAGGSVTVLYTARVDTVNPPAAGTVLRSTASADAVASGAGSAAPVAVDVLVAGAADLAMGMTAAPGSVVPGGTLSYVVSFGNPNATSAPAAVLAMPVPAGTTVVSASAGGTLVDGAVQWEVAALAAGASGQRQVAVQVDAGLPDKSVLVAAAELRDPVTGRSLARGNAVTPVLSAPGLLAALSAAPDPVRPGEVVQYAVTVTNRYTTSEWLHAYAQVPDHATVAASAISGGGSCGQGVTTCGAGQTISWSLGYVGAGGSVTVLYTARVDTVNPPAAGTVLRSTASADAVASGAGSAAPVAVDVLVAGAADLAMGMTAAPGSVVPGGTLSYVVSFGNPNATSAPAAVLAMPVPAGTTVVSASAGGTLVDGAVQWEVAALAAGASGQRQVAVQVDAGLPDKSVLVAAAELRDPVTGRSLARGNAVTPVLSAPGLLAALSAAPDPVRPGEVVQYAVTVTNRYTTSEWLHAYAQVPDHATVAASAISGGGSCGQGVTTCGAGQTISWSLGYVGAGESVTVLYTARIDTVNPPAAGTVLRSTASADAVASGAGSAAPVAVDVLVAGAADLAMGMTAAPGSVVPGGTLSYVVSFGNPNATSAPAAVLAVPVPAGTTVVSASAGGTLVDGAVQWEVAALAAGASGQRQMAVQVDAGLPDKSVLVAAAELRDPVTGRSLARGNAVTPVLSAPGLLAALSAAPDPVRPGEVVQYAVTVTNRYTTSEWLHAYAQVPDHATVAASAISGGRQLRPGGDDVRGGADDQLVIWLRGGRSRG